MKFVLFIEENIYILSFWEELYITSISSMKTQWTVHVMNTQEKLAHAVGWQKHEFELVSAPATLSAAIITVAACVEKMDW